VSEVVCLVHDTLVVVWLFIGTQKRLVVVGSRRDGHTVRTV
jgi:hypothetical protein